VSAGAHIFVTCEDVFAISKPSFKPNYEYSLLDKLFLKQIGPGNKPYSASKLANALFSLELAKKLEGKGVTGVK
jgi:NAD(P)-dependent dehydrogenase (short-subunit alcohol dehydrogenase family)